MSTKQTLRDFYRGDGKKTKCFRYVLLAFDIVILGFLFVSSFYHGHPVVEVLDLIFGGLIVLDFAIRLYIRKNRLKHLLSFYSLMDIVVILSFLLPYLGENFAFLRVIRFFRLFHSYHIIELLRQDFTFFRNNEDIVKSSLNLLLFIFLMTALVFETQVGHNTGVTNYLDAMYFTVATLTTTGFGDIVLLGEYGRVLSIIIMIFGVSLFIRLIQTTFRPNKVNHECQECGLYLHDRDSSHCKHCGNVLRIPDAGLR